MASSPRPVREYIESVRSRYSAYSSSDRWVAALAFATLLIFGWYVSKKDAEIPLQADTSQSIQVK
jgi:hypothetical protein